MKRLFALAVISTLALTGCGKSDFDNNAEKEEAFAAYTCKKSLESPVEQENQAVATAIKVLADENAPAPGECVGFGCSPEQDAELAELEGNATTLFWECMQAGGTEETCRQ